MHALVTAFADRMRVVRGRLTRWIDCTTPSRNGCCSSTPRAYGDGVGWLQQELFTPPIRSRGLIGLPKHLGNYAGDGRFKDEAGAARNLQQQLTGPMVAVCDLRRAGVSPSAFPRPTSAVCKPAKCSRIRASISLPNALRRTNDHILAFFTMLRFELGFYVGCQNLHDWLDPEP